MDDKTKVLRDAVQHTLDNWVGPKPPKLVKALAAFEPEPEMVYTMPEWDSLRLSFPNCICIKGDIDTFLYEDTYNALRELTRVPKAKMGREWWIKVFDTFGAGSPIGGIWNDKQIAEANCAGSGITPIHVREVLPND